jgi:hypothetical protein
MTLVALISFQLPTFCPLPLGYLHARALHFHHLVSCMQFLVSLVHVFLYHFPPLPMNENMESEHGIQSSHSQFCSEYTHLNMHSKWAWVSSQRNCALLLMLLLLLEQHQSAASIWEGRGTTSFSLAAPWGH